MILGAHILASDSPFFLANMTRIPAWITDSLNQLDSDQFSSQLWTRMSVPDDGWYLNVDGTVDVVQIHPAVHPHLL